MQEGHGVLDKVVTTVALIVADDERQSASLN